VKGILCDEYYGEVAIWRRNGYFVTLFDYKTGESGWGPGPHAAPYRVLVREDYPDREASEIVGHYAKKRHENLTLLEGLCYVYKYIGEEPNDQQSYSGSKPAELAPDAG
jgi:hypothetical protein